MLESIHTTTHGDSDHRIMEHENNIDPDKNLFNKLIHDCTYYTDEQFVTSVKLVDSITMIHFNSRSLYSNFEAIKEYLRLFKRPFSVIAVSETWITPDSGNICLNLGFFL